MERGFSVPDVAHMLGLSVRTTERRLQEFNISSRQFFTIIDDQTLNRTIEDILRSFPSYGYRRMTGALLSKGIKVQQVRIGESMRRVNPMIGARFLFLGTLFDKKLLFILMIIVTLNDSGGLRHFGEHLNGMTAPIQIVSAVIS